MYFSKTKERVDLEQFAKKGLERKDKPNRRSATLPRPEGHVGLMGKEEDRIGLLEEEDRHVGRTNSLEAEVKRQSLTNVPQLCPGDEGHVSRIRCLSEPKIFQSS